MEGTTTMDTNTENDLNTELTNTRNDLTRARNDYTNLKQRFAEAVMQYEGCHDGRKDFLENVGIEITDLDKFAVEVVVHLDIDLAEVDGLDDDNSPYEATLQLIENTLDQATGCGNSYIKGLSTIESVVTGHSHDQSNFALQTLWSIA